MKAERRSVAIHVGSASIVMIFAVLCLTVFSTLSFVTANHERKLAEKSTLAVQQYYAADWQCEELYQQIVQCLQTGGGIEQLEPLGVQIEQADGVQYLTYAADIDAEQQLQVRLAVWPDGSVQTKQWKVVAAREWEYKDEIAVWDGE